MGAFSKFNLKDPAFLNAMAMFGAAISPPGSAGRELGMSAQSITQGLMFNRAVEATKRARAGRLAATPELEARLGELAETNPLAKSLMEGRSGAASARTSRSMFGLSPDMQGQAFALGLAQEQAPFALRASAAGVEGAELDVRRDRLGLLEGERAERRGAAGEALDPLREEVEEADLLLRRNIADEQLMGGESELRGRGREAGIAGAEAKVALTKQQELESASRTAYNDMLTRLGPGGRKTATTAYINTSLQSIVGSLLAAQGKSMEELTMFDTFKQLTDRPAAAIALLAGDTLSDSAQMNFVRFIEAANASQNPSADPAVQTPLRALMREVEGVSGGGAEFGTIDATIDLRKFTSRGVKR
ncbi:hypothetical protein LCGC14_1236140 [marine sediment metagenome]|uniref:Uncharacterized protein n=1 Tax=marine sediment metagenome TaxID=412755 RepID=A0A0F9L786_9ZZZZ